MDRWTRTHEALSRAALDLFARQGYAATGTAQVAALAGVSEMTLFRHFPTKADLVLTDPFDPVMAQAVEARPADDPPVRALTEGIREATSQLSDQEADALRHRLRLLTGVPDLAGLLSRSTEPSVTALADALERRGSSPTEARVASHAVIQGLGVALMSWADSDDAADAASLRTVLGRALDVLGGV